MSIQTIWAEQALLPDGWATQVSIDIDGNGQLCRIEPGRPPTGYRTGILMPAPANLHSHAFQRAMAGLTEKRGEAATGNDNFWTWRQLMYRFLGQLNPDHVQAISAYVYMQMLEAGFAAVGEFHYLHHQPNGSPYAKLGELSERVAQAANATGIGMTLLPVLYQQGGADGRPLTSAQNRFGNSLDRYLALVEQADVAVRAIGADSLTGVAPHSLRAVPISSMQQMAILRPEAPVHIHIAEQTAEVDEIVGLTGQRPVRWLLDNCAVDKRWCLVHATHMSADETVAVANRGAVAGLCPITEANLGDGIFDGGRFLQAGGVFGIGSDSNVRISLTEELRLLEYSQRLKDRARAVLCQGQWSNGRTLWNTSCVGGAQALGRNSGELTEGKLADLVSLDATSVEMAGLAGDELLDSAIFASADNLITDVWSAGRHIVQHGEHIHKDELTAHFRRTMTQLRSVL